MNRNLMLIVAGALVASASFAAAAPADFRAANVAAQRHINDFVRLDEDPSAPALLEAQWDALRRTAARWLDQHPKARRSTFEAALKALKPKDLEAKAIPLDDQSWLVAAEIGGFGSAFILADRGHGFSSAWAIDRPQTWASGQVGSLLAWAPENARDSCNAHKPDSNWGECGPLTASIGVLPNDALGARRFYIDGDYAQIAGATVGAQLSVWSWDGSRARPIFSRNYNYMVDQPWTLKVLGDRLKIRSKESLRHVFACGGCEGSQWVTTLQLSGRGVRLVDRQSLTPELDLVDEVYDRIAHRRVVGDLATPSATRFMAAQLGRAGADSKPKTADEPFVGMIANWKMTSSEFCLETDSGGAALFTIARASGRRRIVAAKSVRSGACGGVGSHS